VRIGFVAAEMAPLAKVGGLGDVVAALSAELAARDHDVTVLMPGYPDLPRGLLGSLEAEVAEVPFDGVERRVPLAIGHLGDVRVVLLDDRLVGGRGPYDDTDARDEAYRYALLCRVAADWLAPRCDVLHLHDQHAALTCPMLYGRDRPATLLTIHNLAFQGIHAWDHLRAAGLPGAVREDLLWHGNANAMKAAIIEADAVTTVSPTYAREIRESGFGFGMQPHLRERGEDLSGILNGIDTEVWNPATDPLIEARYDPTMLDGKAVCRTALAHEMGLVESPRRPIIGIVSRLSEQKGFDMLRPVMPEVIALADLVVLGTGDPSIEASFRAAAGRHVGVHIGFDEGLAHRIEAGADLFLMPSRFEPCGLNQMISMRYGTLPVVRRTGGLADTVIDADEEPERGFGFVFEEDTPAALLAALFRGLKAINDGRGPALARRAMATDVSWSASAAAYAKLMERLASTAPRQS
jgi:starch synthase